MDARGIRTCYAYDALHRLTSKNYNDTPQTPTANFSYDQSSVTVGSWTSGTLANPKGRLTEATTTASGATQTAMVYSYDAMGRVANLWQCAPYNCGSSSIWSMPYTYDLAGDVTSYWNPAGFIVNQGIDVNQRPTSLTWGANVAVSSISYTPWGAISTICGGGGCGQSQETRQYNSRLQPVLMELGNSNSVAADYCLVYNYYSGNPMPSSCAAPTGTSGSNNGSILGSWYQDNVNTGYSHKWTYNYDAVGRLSQATATDFSNNTLLSQPYTYTSDHSNGQYGNMSCALGGSGYCPQVSFDASTNRVTSIGSLTATYDAAGDMTYDGSCSFQYDAEGRVNYSSCPGQWQYPMYNALGQRVEDYQGSATDNLTLTYPRDIFGQRTGAFAQWPSQNWIGWNVYWSSVAGQRLNMGGTSSYVDHADAVGTTTMETDQAGTVVWDTENYPWGRIWQQTGTRPSGVFAGLDWQVNDPSYPSDTREYDQRLGRWMTPDPDNAGADVTDPQSWNMYSYAGNNPITNSDPSGLYCVQGSDGSWHDDGGGGETCAEAASGPPETVTVSAQASSLSYLTGAIYDFEAFQFRVAEGLLNLPIQSAQQAYTGFSNLFLNNKPEGAVPLVLGIAGMGLIPEETEIEGIVTRAESAVGREEITVSSKGIAEQAVDKFLGPGKQPLIQNYGSRAGQQIGWKSEGGLKLVRDDSAAARPHYNFQNLQGGGNLHVYFK